MIKRNEEIKGCVLDIQKFSIHDGPGIRTTVFLKGCPLKCLWCHNPESQDPTPEVFFNPQFCIGCGICKNLCRHNCHSFSESMHVYDRQNCIRCMSCSNECPSDALKASGKYMTTGEVMYEVMKDMDYYIESGGGLTISGGEPMMQPAFTGQLLHSAKNSGIHTCIETCGFTAFGNFEAVFDYINIFLYDYKETDPILHHKFTGVSNERIIENLTKLDNMNASIILRCPIIPTLNDRDDHFEGIGRMANKLKNLMHIEIMPFHPYGSSKSVNIGKVYELKHIKAPDAEAVKCWAEKVKSYTDIEVRAQV